MDKTSLIKLTVALFILSGGLSFGQDTGTITQTINFSDLSDPASVVETFDSFNTSLGTLDSVELVLSNVTVSGTASVTNQTTTPSTPSYYTLQLEGNYTVSDGVNSTINIQLLSSSETSPEEVDSSDTFTTGTLTSTPASNSTNVTDLAYYESDEPTLTLNLTSQNAVTVSGSAPYQANESSVGSGTIELVYNYTLNATPEPSTLALGLIGLGFVFWRYRRGSRARV